MKDDLVRIAVRDCGSGIPAEFRAHIFERFAQADATNTRLKGGTGLGLAIAKQIVERLGGEVGFVDVLGGGTIFYVDLPSWGGKADVRHLKEIERDKASDSESAIESLLIDVEHLVPPATGGNKQLQ